MIRARISAPTPNWGQPPSTVTRWFVFVMLVSMVSESRGLIVRRFMTYRRKHGDVNNKPNETEPFLGCVVLLNGILEGKHSSFRFLLCFVLCLQPKTHDLWPYALTGYAHICTGCVMVIWDWLNESGNYSIRNSPENQSESDYEQISFLSKCLFFECFV